MTRGVRFGTLLGILCTLGAAPAAGGSVAGAHPVRCPPPVEELEPGALFAATEAERGPSVRTSDGAWSRVPQPTTSRHAAVYDPVRDRLIVFGGEYTYYGMHDETWALPFGGTPGWSRFATTGTPPPAGLDYVGIYDPVRDRLIVFRGASAGVWTLSLSGTPTWTELAVAGPLPEPRSEYVALYDPPRDRLIVHGGLDTNAVRVLDDVWALALSGTPAWSDITPSLGARVSRDGHAAIYDPVGDRMIVYGGEDSTYSAVTEPWALSLSGTPGWTELVAAGGGPGPRWGHSGIHDPIGNRMIVYGAGGETWSLSLSGSAQWSVLSAAEAGPTSWRIDHAALYDPVRERMVIHGGLTNNGLIHCVVMNDLWALSLATPYAWSRVESSPPMPMGLGAHTAIVDVPRSRMLVFGGFGGGAADELWSLSLSGAPEWASLTSSGPLPPGWFEHTAIHDPVRDRMVVFGNAANPWALSLDGASTWSEIPASGSPGGRSEHAAIYDPVRDRMIIFGGAFDRNDTWALDFSGTPAWTQWSPMGSPPPGRRGHSAVYDPVRDRMIVYGGTTFGSVSMGDLWALSLSGTPAWSQIVPAGTPPLARFDHTAVYDAGRDRMLVYAGRQGGIRFTDAWALSLTGTPTWTRLVPEGTRPLPRGGHSAVMDAARDRMVVFGGWSGGHAWDCWHTDAQMLAFSSVADAPRVTIGDELALRPTNPFHPPATLRWSLARGGRVSLTVYDVQGRRVRDLGMRGHEAGHHVSTWDGRDDRGLAMGSGLYICRLASEGRAITKRFLLVR